MIRLSGIPCLVLFLLLFAITDLSAQGRVLRGPAECKSEAAASASERGFKFADKEEHEKALEEYLRAVRLEPSCAAVYHNLGTGYAALERHVDAVSAYQKALQFNPSWSWGSVLSIGRSYAALDRLDEAISAYDAVIEFQPSDEAAYRSRAGLYLRKGNGSSAVADAKSYLKIKGWRGNNSLYVVFIGYFALRQMQQTDAANRFLDDALSKAKKNDWPFPVLRYLRKETKEQDLLAIASDIGRMTEARTYIGLDLSLSGKVEDALGHLNWVKLNGKKSYSEYRFALSEIARIEAERK